MRFFRKKGLLDTEKQLPENEKGKISFLMKGRRIFIAAFSGVLLAMAFPPLNLSAFAFVAFVPVMIMAMGYFSKRELFALGYIQGFFWAIFSFWWLREIELIVPFLLSLILGLWFGFFALLVKLVYRGIVYPKNIHLQVYNEREKYIPVWWRELLFAIVVAAIFPCLEYIRINMFPWNFIGVSQYKQLALIQIVAYTGIYGVTFLIILVNACFASTLVQIRKSLLNGKRCNLYASLVVMIVLMGVIFWGWDQGLMKGIKFSRSAKMVNFGVVQGDISQRRHSNDEMAEEALNIYLELSEKLLKENPQIDLVIWPETAVPYPYFGAHNISRKYRYRLNDLISCYQKPFLIGSLDFFENRATKSYDLTNAALLFDIYGRNIAKYEKINRVPFGEFIPLRKFYPTWLVNMIDMGRDLKAGTRYEPLKLPAGVAGGMAICYESIFASLCRRERQLGANLFIAINNDAWYPVSSEPEQHLANAVFRAVENGIPALRVGNNGGSLVISPNGKVRQSLLASPIARGRAYGVISVGIAETLPTMTFYTRYGDVFLGILSLIAVISMAVCLYKELNLKKIRSFNN